MANDFGVGRTIGPYDIEELLGGGGMATVYRGVHRSLGVQRAIKVMSSSLAVRNSFVELFYREARLASGLRHPNIVQIFDISQQDGLHYLVMELLEGRSLHDVIRQDAPLPLTRVVHLVGQLAEALDYAHRQGIAHRDVKPANAFVGPRDRLTLVDFGIARAADATHLTVTHGIGTPEYMAPEVFDEQLAEPGADGHAIGIGTDLYSLGVVAYVLVTGKVPFFGRTPNAVAYSQVNRAPPPPRLLRPDLPPAAEAVILRQLSKKPGERHRPARSFAVAFAESIHQADPVGVPSTFSPAFHTGATTLLPGDPVYGGPPRVSASGRPSVGATPARSRRRWLGAAAGLVFLAAALRFAGVPAPPLFNLAADSEGAAESRAARSTLAASTPSTTTPTAVALLPLPTATSTPPVTAPTTVPTSAPPPQSAVTAPNPDPGLSLELQADETIAQAVALIQDQNYPNPDQTLEKIDKLYREMDPVSEKRPVVEEVMVRALLEDSDRRLRAAFVLKNSNEGRESQRILGDARQRFDRVAQLRPNDSTLQDRVNRGREQAELTSWWVDFDAAYYAKQNDAQIAALTKIVEKSPDFKTVEGPAKEKLYAAWIAKAEESWGAKQVELARTALDQATGVDPDHPRARELRLAWFPPRPAPVRAVPPRGSGTWTAPARSGGAAPDQGASMPESQPAPAVQQPQRLVPQSPFVNNEINAPNVGNQSYSGN